MNAKRAIVRLFVAVTGLLASLFELAGAFVRLGTAVLERFTNRLRNPVAAPISATHAMALAPTVIAPAASVAPRATVCMTVDERLTSALLSLGFRAANVRAFAASVCGREAPLEVLVKEGIVALSAN
jgi:hypothetical protein